MGFARRRVAVLRGSSTLFGANEEIYICDREAFLDELDSNPLFEEFWQYAYEEYPEKGEYLASLMDETMPFEYRWIGRAYYRYLFGPRFDELDEQERKKFEAGFEALRPKIYRAVLEGEATRLNCSVFEVRPVCPVLSLLPGNDEESKLADLPGAIFGRIMNFLETVEVFKLTLVSKHWKRLVYDNMIKRLEHAKTTHLLTFTEWTDPLNTTYKNNESHYYPFSWGLIQWCCGASDSLETVIVDHVISPLEATTILQSCPNLKNLKIDCGYSGIEEGDDGHVYIQAPLPKLEFYHGSTSSWRKGRDLEEQVLLASDSLRYFSGSLRRRSCIEGNTRDRIRHAFQKLIALELKEYSLQFLEILAECDDLQLRYLSFGSLAPLSYWDKRTFAYSRRKRDLLARLFPKLTKLEILKDCGTPGLSNVMIKSMTELNVKLKLALFYDFSTFAPESTKNWLSREDDWQSEVLADFGHMLLSSDPELDLSQICLIAKKKQILRDLQHMRLGLKILDYNENNFKDRPNLRLSAHVIRRHLGIHF